MVAVAAIPAKRNVNHRLHDPFGDVVWIKPLSLVVSGPCCKCHSHKRAYRRHRPPRHRSCLGIARDAEVGRRRAGLTPANRLLDVRAGGRAGLSGHACDAAQNGEQQSRRNENAAGPGWSYTL